MTVDVAAIITALAGLLTAVGAFIIIIKKVTEVHTLVNSNFKMMLRREEVLITALQQSGIKIPPNEEIVDDPAAT